MGWTIHMQPWRVLKRQTKRDSSRQELLHQIMSPSSNLISFSVFNLVLKTTSLQLFSFLKLFETSIVVTSRWPIAEGSSNARFWPRKMGRRWLPSTQTEDMAGRSAWLGGHRRRKTATRGKRVSFAFFTSLAVWLAWFFVGKMPHCQWKMGSFLGQLAWDQSHLKTELPPWAAQVLASQVRSKEEDSRDPPWKKDSNTQIGPSELQNSLLDLTKFTFQTYNSFKPSMFFFLQCFLPPSKASSKKNESFYPTKFLTGGLLVASNSQGFISALAMAAVIASRAIGMPWLRACAHLLFWPQECSWIFWVYHIWKIEWFIHANLRYVPECATEMYDWEYGLIQFHQETNVARLKMMFLL